MATYKCGDVTVKPFKDNKNGCWYIVSDLYKPPSAGKVGSGIIWTTPYKTKKEVLQALNEIPFHRLDFPRRKAKHGTV